MSGRTRGTGFRFPWAPLEQHLRRTLRPWYPRDLPGYDDRDFIGYDGELITDRIIGDALGVTASSVLRTRQEGFLSPLKVDRWCIRLGVHPSSIYGELWWEYAASPDSTSRKRATRQCA